MNRGYLTFFTATILNWKHILRFNSCKKIITYSLKYLVEHNRIKIYGFVIMSNHIHLIWRILDNHIYKDVQRDFLKYTAQQIKFNLLSYHPNELSYHYVNKKDRKFQFWKRNPLSVELLTMEVVEEKLDYIHFNPVKKGKEIARTPEEYYYSSARYYELNIDDWGFITHYMEDC